MSVRAMQRRVFTDILTRIQPLITRSWWNIMKNSKWLSFSFGFDALFTNIQIFPGIFFDNILKRSIQFSKWVSILQLLKGRYMTPVLALLMFTGFGGF